MPDGMSTSGLEIRYGFRPRRAKVKSRLLQMGKLDHVAYTIADYQTRPVGIELKRRGMISEDSDAENGTSLGINCIDVNDFKTQIWRLEPCDQCRPGESPDRWRSGRSWPRSRRSTALRVLVSCPSPPEAGAGYYLYAICFRPPLNHPECDPPEVYH